MIKNKNIYVEEFRKTLQINVSVHNKVEEFLGRPDIAITSTKNN